MPDRFSWILPDKLAVGSFPTSPMAIACLRSEGVTAVLSLMEETERPIPPEIPYSFVWKRVPIPDGFKGGIPTESQFVEALQVLSRWHQKSHVVYVHCLAGVGRSPAVSAAYLVHSQGISVEKALMLVKAQHPYAAPDPNQIQVIHNLFRRGQNSSAQAGDPIK